jgi:hypothetical protein
MVVLIALFGVALGVLATVPLWEGGKASADLNPPPAPSSALEEVLPLKSNMTDPFVLTGPNLDYVYTGAAGFTAPHVPVRPFKVLGQWGPRQDALPTLPAWAEPWIWTPDVHRTPTGYVMWYAALDKNKILPNGQDAKCIGQATATNPLGPFTPTSDQPVICQQWGSIDPRTFTDADGQSYLLWKADNNAAWGLKLPTAIWSQRLASDGTTLEGQPVQLVTSQAGWEHGLMEAPDMVLHDGTYYVFFSSWRESGVGVFTCTGPMGPCTDRYEGPFIGANLQGVAPGEESLFTQGGATWIIFSPYSTGFAAPVAVARVAFGLDGPYVAEADGATPGV